MLAPLQLKSPKCLKPASLFYLIIFSSILQIKSECDQTFVSRGGLTNGTFHAPEIHNPFNLSRQCLYTFIAAADEKVLITFYNFDLRGLPPDGAAVGELPTCTHEYMDIFSEVVSLEPGELINSAFGGRYCGPIPPRRKVSLYKAIVLAFFTDKANTPSNLFNGTFQFINATEYEIGTPVPNTLCSFNVNSNKRKTGVLLSPTYPGSYPKDTTCNYQFIGQPGQRIRLEFRDFDLFFGGPHCPLDWVRIYDGLDNSSALVGMYCGQQRNLVIYSSDHRLLVTFFTLPRAANTQNRGFKGIFEFSESFVMLDFINKSDSEHIRGSECDQKILSRKESTGLVYSPNYPYLYIPKIVCRYFIYGMQDSQNLERVRLEFQKFEIPKGTIAKPDGFCKHCINSGAGRFRRFTVCSDGYLKIYLKGQETTDSYDKFDAELCGDAAIPILTSDGPRLVAVFSSGELQGKGFKAKYSFETEYRVPGTAAPDGVCSFTYRSTAKKRGELNSPRHPSNYPSNADCTYTLLALPSEQLTLVFDSFKVRADAWNATPGQYGGATCTEDWVEAVWIGRGGLAGALGRWCGNGAPGPLQSPRAATALQLKLHTNDEGQASGFKARYVFEEAKSIFGDCGGNISGSEWGSIWSPDWPGPYKPPTKNQASQTCHWFITVKPNKRVLIHFIKFAVEGQLTARGCPAAVLRLWLGGPEPPIELCGELEVDKAWQYVSAANTMRLSFIISDKSVGAAGWKVIWTEVETVQHAESCDGFVCEGHACVSSRALCSGLEHCYKQPKKNCAAQLAEQARVSSNEQWDEFIWWAVASIFPVIVIIAIIACIVRSHLKRARGRRPRVPPPPPRPPPRPRPLSPFITNTV